MAPDATTAAIAAAQARELIAAYRSADYVVRLPRGARACLRVGAPAPPALAALLREGEYAGLITAWHPRSHVAAQADNRARQHELAHLLRGRCRLLLIGAGTGPDWREPSLCAIAIELAALDALARRFRQNAVLAFGALERVRLRIYRADWREALTADDDTCLASMQDANAAARTTMR